MATASYAPRNVNALYGPLPLLGLASGSMFDVRMLGPGVSAVIGTQGEGVLVDSHNQSAELTCRFMGTGAGRNTLAALRAHFVAGNPPLPLVLRSADTGEVLAGGVAKIKNLPDVSFGDDAPVREITFVIVRFEQFNSIDPVAFV